MENSKEKNWYSNDWKHKNNPTIPYNGLQIKAIANYGLPTTSPSVQKLVSVELEIIDFTCDVMGVSSKVQLTKPKIWYDILIPENKDVTPPQPNLNFTVAGIKNGNLGVVKLDHLPNGIYLDIQFRYGPTNKKREEIGYIMRFDSVYIENYDPIEVEE